jgi:uncharacterized protein (DUF1800 family)
LWTAATGASAYTVYRGTTSKQQTLLASGITTTAFVDSAVINGPTYFYKVTATNAGGESAMSAEASASPTGPAAGLNPALSAAHRLLRQATWGARPGDAEALRTMGAEAFVNAQLAAAPSAYPDILFTLGTDVVQNHWVLTALTGTDQLRQRVAFALHKIWVVSGVEVNNSTALVTYHRLLSQHAFGNYRELMERVTLNPAMGRYLNMLNSRSVQVSNVPANENYARELLQLFTLGTSRLSRDGVAYVRPPKQALVASEFPVAPPEDPIKASEVPTYTEADVKELARILTGWTFGDGNPATIPTRAGSTNYAVEMEPVADLHDAGAKRFLGVAFPAGQSARADLE